MSTVAIWEYFKLPGKEDLDKKKKYIYIIKEFKDRIPKKYCLPTIRTIFSSQSLVLEIY